MQSTGGALRIRAVGYVLTRFGLTEILGYDSELIALHGLGPFQWQGLGRRLIAAVANELQIKGSESLMLCVMKGNRARGFYERLGGQLPAEQKMSRAGSPEVAFEWPSIQVLCGQEDQAEGNGQG